MFTIRNNIWSNVFKGILSATTADLVLILFHAFISRTVIGPETSAADPSGYFKVMVLGPIASGAPAGVLFGFFREAASNSTVSRRKAAAKFWIAFWGVTLLILFLDNALFLMVEIKTMFVAASSLLVFTGVWTYTMTVISDNPLSFNHLMPEEESEQEDSNDEIYNYNQALIKKRRD